MEERETRSFPWDSAELAWQHYRPRQLWTPVPEIGSYVFYRNEHWGPETRAKVIEHQDPRDYTDHYLWHVLRDEGGNAVSDELGRRMLTPVDDPWITLKLDTDWGRLTCREARVRGSAGWLPLDWERRFRPNPFRSLKSNSVLRRVA